MLGVRIPLSLSLESYVSSQAFNNVAFVTRGLSFHTGSKKAQRCQHNPRNFLAMGTVARHAKEARKTFSAGPVCSLAHGRGQSAGTM